MKLDPKLKVDSIWNYKGDWHKVAYIQGGYIIIFKSGTYGVPDCKTILADAFLDSAEYIGQEVKGK